MNQSAVDLLGGGSVDVVQSIVNAIDVVQENLSDINHFEIDLNQELNRALNLQLAIGGEEVDAAYEQLAVLGLGPQSSPTDVAIAIAQLRTREAYQSLVDDRDVAAASSRLAALGLDSSVTDLDLAEAVAERDQPAALDQAKADRDLLAANAALLESWKALAAIGFDGETTDAEINGLFNDEQAVANAKAFRDTLADPGADEGELLIARGMLALLGIPEGADDTQIEDLLNQQEQIDDTIAHRDTVANADTSLVEAALRLQDLGVAVDATDLQIARAIAGEALQGLVDDRALVRDYIADSIKGQLESLDDIASATVIEGSGISSDPWIVQYESASGDAITSPNSNVVLGDPVPVAENVYRQSLYLASSFQIALGPTELTIQADQARGEIADQLAALQSVFGANVIRGDGSPGDPWIIEYTSESASFDDALTVIQFQRQARATVGDPPDLQARNLSRQRRGIV